MSSSTATPRQNTPTPAGLIAFAWALVGVPLVYGLVQTIRAASTLFTG